MIQSDAINWSVAILLSLLVHSMILMGNGAQMGVKKAAVLQTPIITRLSFNKPLDEVVPAKPIPIKKPEPVKKIEAKPVLAKPVKKKPLKKKPVKKEPIKKEHVVQKKKPPEKTEPVRQVASLAQPQGRQVSHSTKSLLQSEQRQQYLHKLLSHIESFKFYPRAARKRSIEGNVKIFFILHDDGYYEQLTLDGGHSALVKASQQALESAVPLPAPPKDIELPRKIEFAMVYSLKN